MNNEPLEEQEKVEQYESLLESSRKEVLEHYARVSARYREAGKNRLACTAWPLRPLFLKKDRLHTIGTALVGQLESCRDVLISFTEDRGSMAKTLNFPLELLKELELETGLGSPDFLSAARPDGFLQADRFVVSEYNVGSGLLATLSYTEVLFELLGEGPLARKLGLKDGNFGRPFQNYLSLLRGRAQSGSAAHIALFSPAEEHKDVYRWEKKLFETLFERNGFTVEFMDEHSLEVDSEKRLISRQTGRTFQLLLQMTTGEYFLQTPNSLRSSNYLRGARAGSVPHLHPLACLLLGKGILPANLGGAGEKSSVRIAEATYPTEEAAPEYRLNKDKYVIKRSWSGKDTVVGCSTGGRAWNRIVAEAINSKDFIVQDYHPLPTTRLPYLVDGKLEYIAVRFELSPFLIEGKYCGSLVRYAPDAEGLRLSPSPPDMGMTIVYAS